MSTNQEVAIDCPTGRVKVFFINKSNSLMGYDDITIELYADDYHSRDAMMQDATEKLTGLVDGGVVNPYIYDINAGFKTRFLRNKGVVNAELWNMMRMDKRQIGVLEAYIEAFGITDIGEAEVTLSNAEQAYIGEYKDNAAVVGEYLEEDAKLDANTIQVLTPHINIDTLAESLMMDRKVNGNYQFRIQG